MGKSHVTSHLKDKATCPPVELVCWLTCRFPPQPNWDHFEGWALQSAVEPTAPPPSTLELGNLGLLGSLIKMSQVA